MIADGSLVKITNMNELIYNEGVKGGQLANDEVYVVMRSRQLQPEQRTRVIMTGKGEEAKPLAPVKEVSNPPRQLLILVKPDDPEMVEYPVFDVDVEVQL